MKKIVCLLLCFALVLPSFGPLRSNPYSYIVMDVETRRIIRGNNYHSKSLVASTAKIMTAKIAITYGELFELVTIYNEDVIIEGSKLYVKEDDELLLIDLVYGLMLRSGNDAANAISRTVFGGHDDFVFKMNEMAKVIGMSNSSFANASGLDESEFNLSTAFDMALLKISAMECEIFRNISSTSKHKTKSINNNYFLWHNKHKLINAYDNFISGKTGYTKKAGRILVSVGVKNDREVVIVTINDPNDWQNHKGLLNQVPVLRTFRILEQQVLTAKMDNVEKVINVDSNIYLALTNNESRNIFITFYILGSTANMVVYLEEQVIFSKVLNLI